jgi:hypothetical protein
MEAALEGGDRLGIPEVFRNHLIANQ